MENGVNRYLGEKYFTWVLRSPSRLNSGNNGDKEPHTFETFFTSTQSLHSGVAAMQADYQCGTMVIGWLRVFYVKNSMNKDLLLGDPILGLISVG